MVRRRGLIRSAARTAGRTAVIAGTATAVSRKVAGRQQPKHTPNQPHPQGVGQTSHASANDIVVHLQQLADLRASGALTEKEFAAAKARLFTS